jgi:alkyl hydroperoxide reductase subunit AhpF
VVLAPSNQSAVVTDRGDLLTADVIVTAVGCAPNTEWLEDAFHQMHTGDVSVVVWK